VKRLLILAPLLLPGLARATFSIVACDKDGTCGAAIAEAEKLAPGWDRVWRRAARFSVQLGERAGTEAALGEMAKINPDWARTERADPLYQASPARQ